LAGIRSRVGVVGGRIVLVTRECWKVEGVGSGTNRGSH
jgi:hypothetical protein